MEKKHLFKYGLVTLIFTGLLGIVDSLIPTIPNMIFDKVFDYSSWALVDLNLLNVVITVLFTVDLCRHHRFSWLYCLATLFTGLFGVLCYYLCEKYREDESFVRMAIKYMVAAALLVLHSNLHVILDLASPITRPDGTLLFDFKLHNSLIISKVLRGIIAVIVFFDLLPYRKKGIGLMMTILTAVFTYFYAAIGMAFSLFQIIQIEHSETISKPLRLSRFMVLCLCASILTSILTLMTNLYQWQFTFIVLSYIPMAVFVILAILTFLELRAYNMQKRVWLLLLTVFGFSEYGLGIILLDSKDYNDQGNPIEQSPLTEA